MKMEITTNPCDDKYRVGVDVTIVFENHTVGTFIGLINNFEYPHDKSGENYKRIVWLDEFVLEDFENHTTHTLKNFENAVEFYVLRDSHNKVLKQKRRLVDGSIDTCTIAYRWN